MNKKRSKKAQSSFEFLTTYGWAMVTILITVSALVYFGIIRPGRLIPDRCTFGAGVGCRDYSISNDGINLRLSNEIGKDVIIDGLAVSKGVKKFNCNSAVSGKEWKRGEVKYIPVGCDFAASDTAEGEKQRLSVRINYHLSGSDASYQKSFDGEVFATVGRSIASSFESQAIERGSWSFDEASGTAAGDSSGNGNNAVLYNGAAWVPGKKGNAISFDGLDDYAEIADSASLDITSQITIMAWVNVKALTGFADQDMILNKEGIPYEMAIHDNTGPADGIHTCAPASDQIPAYNLAFYLGGVTGLPSHNCGWTDGGGPIQLNSWAHVALTYDGTKVRTYINGELKKEYPGISGAIQMNDNPLRIGARGGGASNPPPQTNWGALFKGLIDEVGIYGRALSDNEILIKYLS